MKDNNKGQQTRRAQPRNDQEGQQHHFGRRKYQNNRVKLEIFHPGSFSRPIGEKKDQLRPTHNPFVRSPPNLIGDQTTPYWSANPKDRTGKSARIRRYTMRPYPVDGRTPNGRHIQNHGIGATTSWKSILGASISIFKKNTSKRTSQNTRGSTIVFPKPNWPPCEGTPNPLFQMA